MNTSAIAARDVMAAPDASSRRTELHHLAGRHNDEGLIVVVDANLHRLLTDAQRFWPPGVLENRQGFPTIALTAIALGVCDAIEHGLELHPHVPKVRTAIASALDGPALVELRAGRIGQ